MIDTHFGIYHRQFVGIDPRFFTRQHRYSILASYIPNFYPKFYEGNPFTHPEDYKLPYKHIDQDFMMLVYQMPDRLDLLQYADDNNMNYNVFIDFVMNHFHCLNEELGEEQYVLYLNSNYLPYVKYSGHGGKKPHKLVIEGERNYGRE